MIKIGFWHVPARLFSFKINNPCLFAQSAFGCKFLNQSSPSISGRLWCVGGLDSPLHLLPTEKLLKSKKTFQVFWFFREKSGMSGVFEEWQREFTQEQVIKYTPTRKIYFWGPVKYFISKSFTTLSIVTVSVCFINIDFFTMRYANTGSIFLNVMTLQELLN